MDEKSEEVIRKTCESIDRFLYNKDSMELNIIILFEEHLSKITHLIESKSKKKEIIEYIDKLHFLVFNFEDIDVFDIAEIEAGEITSFLIDLGAEINDGKFKNAIDRINRFKKVFIYKYI